LRELLGLTLLDTQILLILTVTILATWGIAEVYSWLALMITNNKASQKIDDIKPTILNSR
jgi:GH35 family endo-1,4-beta-xylanase